MVGGISYGVRVHLPAGFGDPGGGGPQVGLVAQCQSKVVVAVAVGRAEQGTTAAQGAVAVKFKAAHREPVGFKGSSLKPVV